MTIDMASHLLTSGGLNYVIQMIVLFSKNTIINEFRIQIEFVVCFFMCSQFQPRNFSFVVKMFAQTQVDTLLDGNDVDECQRKCISRHTTSFLNAQ